MPYPHFFCGQTFEMRLVTIRTIFAKLLCSTFETSVVVELDSLTILELVQFSHRASPVYFMTAHLIDGYPKELFGRWEKNKFVVDGVDEIDRIAGYLICRVGQRF